MAGKANRVVAGVGVAIAGLVAVEALIRMRTPKLSETLAGDPALLDRAAAILAQSPGPRDKVSIAVVQDGIVAEAHFGANRNTVYEIGSITKTMTGSLFADMIERGEVKAQSRLGEFFDLGSSPAAAITLGSLATHSSGLPGMAVTLRNVTGVVLWLLLANDPRASSTLRQLIADAKSCKLKREEYEYSNLGFSLLGQALAKRADRSYSELLSERIFKPLGMTQTFTPSQIDDLPADSPRGYTLVLGRKSAPWTLGAEAPSGSVRSTLADMVRYLQAQLDETAPGITATKPIQDIGGRQRIGYGWHIDGESLTWHNGATGGFSSWISFDRNTRRGVIVLSNTMLSVDDLGLTLTKDQAR